MTSNANTSVSPALTLFLLVVFAFTFIVKLWGEASFMF